MILCPDVVSPEENRVYATDCVKSLIRTKVESIQSTLLAPSLYLDEREGYVSTPLTVFCTPLSLERRREWQRESTRSR
jgi:hypothetical protein